MRLIPQIVAKARFRYEVDAEVRAYHNFEHATRVAQNCLTLNENAADELLYAALYHDAVYIPGSGEDANERCSAAAFKKDWNTYCKNSLHRVSVLDVESVCQLIRNTSIDMHLTHMRLQGNLATLLDADLESLATNYYKFTLNQEAIIIEQGGEVNKENLRKCAEFLRQFLQVRPSIYHTDKARELWEKQARENILKLLDETQ
jgi:predicted metal-dependent HD superfamily phosphohydrolase